MDDGLKIRAFHTIRELVNKDHKVTLVCFIKDNDYKNVKNLKKELDIDLNYVKLDITIFNLIPRIYHTLFSRYPYYMRSMYQKDFKKMLKTILIDSSFDLAYIYDRSMILYVNEISDLPKILDSVDSQSLNSLSGLKSSDNIVHKIFWYISYIKSKNLEKSIYSLYNHVITISERDAEQLRNISNLKILSIPSGVDLSYFKPSNVEKIPYSLTFLGAMDAFSNQQAVFYFINEIVPTIKQSFPSLKLFIIGRNPPDEILKLHDNINTFVMGYIEDIRSYIDKSEIIISPLKMASGLQTKILVAMAMNKPIISTNESIGEIINVIDGNDIIIASNNKEFAQKIINLFSNKDLLNETGKYGRDIIKENYSWDSLGNKLNIIIQDLLEKNY